MATTIQRLMTYREETDVKDGEIDKETVGLIWEYYRQKQALSFQQIASLVGVDLEVVEAVIENGTKNKTRLPTEEQIRERCREIQREWTREERRQRQVVKPVHWVPAMLHDPRLDGVID